MFGKLSAVNKERLINLLEREFAPARIAVCMGVSLATAKRWRAQWKNIPRRSSRDTAPEPEPIARAPFQPSGFIPEIPKSRLMGGRA